MMFTSETCKLRYYRPPGTDWHVERINASTAALRKRVLEDMGWVVVVSGPVGVANNTRGITAH